MPRVCVGTRVPLEHMVLLTLCSPQEISTGCSLELGKLRHRGAMSDLSPAVNQHRCPCFIGLIGNDTLPPCPASRKYKWARSLKWAWEMKQRTGVVP